MRNSPQVKGDELIQQHTFNKIDTNEREIDHKHKRKSINIRCKYKKNSPIILKTYA